MCVYSENSGLTSTIVEMKILLKGFNIRFKLSEKRITDLKIGQLKLLNH